MLSYKKYINEELYIIARWNLNINPNTNIGLIFNKNLVDIIGDGNYLFRQLSRFRFGNKNLHERIRNEIYNEALNRLLYFPDITTETEQGPINLRDYVIHIAQDWLYRRKLEIWIASDIYNINKATFNEIVDSTNLTLYLVNNYFYLKFKVNYWKPNDLKIII